LVDTKVLVPSLMAAPNAYDFGTGEAKASTAASSIRWSARFTLSVAIIMTQVQVNGRSRVADIATVGAGIHSRVS
jgi:hypothetical protein